MSPFKRQPLFGNVRHIHIVGIGGIGMSAIADLLLHRGFTVSGSDRRLSEITERLQSRGASIFQGHHPDHIDGAHVVVHTSAVKADENPETAEAQKRGIPVIKRAEILSELMQRKFSIGVAGTHGKTTTTTMTAQVVQAGGFDPSAIVGGRVQAFQRTNSLAGEGDIVVVEADEFDRTFLQLPADIAIITNIEIEHVDIYADLDDLKSAFTQFAQGVPFYGSVILCLDDPHAASLLPHLDRRTITYGFDPAARLRATDLRPDGFYTHFSVLLDNQPLGEVRLKAPGRHNVQNALAAVAVGLELGMPFPEIQQGLATYDGILRRFHCQADRGDILIIDDYAHHPTEVAATLSAARSGFPDKRLIAIFQPHLYSRTREFHAHFGQALTAADLLFITDVYPSREAPLPGITGELVAHEARRLGHPDVRYVPSLHDLPSLLAELAAPGDLFVTLGAGDIDRVGRHLATLLPHS